LLLDDVLRPNAIFPFAPGYADCAVGGTRSAAMQLTSST
jgi:hypothetical protein